MKKLSLEEFLTKVGGKESDIVSYDNIDEALKAVENNGDALRYVKDDIQNEAIALKAVENNGYALRYVKDDIQNEAIALKAVENNGDALRYVNKAIFKAKTSLKITIEEIEVKFGCTVEIVKTREMK